MVSRARKGFGGRLAAVCGAALLASGPAVGRDDPTVSAPMDRTTLERLATNSGATLQWIGWERRGTVDVRREGDVVYLTGSQIDANGGGTLWLDGRVSEAGPDYFIFDGLIRMANTPDTGRICEADKTWRFAITQNRRYYRLREFEWCDGLTDYIDIYF